MNCRSSLAPLAALLALAGGAANAAAIDAGLQAMRDYNLIVLKDLQSSSQVEGRAFVGGDLGGGSSSYLTKPGAQGGGTALVVGGDVTGGAKNVGSGGDVKVGGDLDSGANMNGGGDVYAGGDVRKVNANGASVHAGGDVKNTNAKDIYAGGAVKHSNGTTHAGAPATAGLQDSIEAQAAAYAGELAATAGYFAGLDPTHVLAYSANGQQAIFDAGAGAGVAVFAISDLKAALQGRSQLIFATPTTYDAVIINVAGLDVSLPSSINFNGPAGLGSKVIWNFYQATSVNLGSKSWYGSVLAPHAHMQMNGSIEGSVVARSMTQNGVIRMGGFSAEVAMNDMRNAVPEPATWLMMILGFGGVGAVLRRRRAALAPA